VCPSLTCYCVDLKAQYEVQVEEGLDTFIVIDGLPVVPEDSRQKLVKFLLRKLNSVGSTSEDAVFMPVNDKKQTEGCVWDLKRDTEGSGYILIFVGDIQICLCGVRNPRAGCGRRQAAARRSSR
jgi:hypothetical protein